MIGPVGVGGWLWPPVGGFPGLGLGCGWLLPFPGGCPWFGGGRAFLEVHQQEVLLEHRGVRGHLAVG